jgi:multisubunit Na+/H+ antiporter MnhC subunit
MITIKPTTEPTWVIATNGELNIPAVVNVGSEFSTGLTDVEEYTTREEFLTRLDVLGIDYNEDEYVAEEVLLIPNWDGLYTTLLDSQVYQHLVGLSLQFTAVNSALDKVIAAINYGDKKPDSQIAWDAFQSAVNLLLYALGLVEQGLSGDHVTEIRDALDGNGFWGIRLG